ncbi:MAG: HNH endonuclease [Chloroflexi bacterium]|nr:HNH endonuclease [Chloroflexota bacterium]
MTSAVSQIPNSIRYQVRQRANKRCEYCGLPEGFSFYGHQVDHIISVKHKDSSDLNNLAWACFDCNNTKGSDVAAYDDETGQLVPLFNPRTQSWNEHFDLDGAIIVGITAIGRATVSFLKLNRDEQVNTRSDLVEIGLW